MESLPLLHFLLAHLVLYTFMLLARRDKRQKAAYSSIFVENGKKKSDMEHCKSNMQKNSM